MAKKEWTPETAVENVLGEDYEEGDVERSMKPRGTSKHKSHMKGKPGNPIY